MSNMQGAQGPFASQKQHVGDGNQAQSLGRQCSICERLSQEKDDTSQSLWNLGYYISKGSGEPPTHYGGGTKSKPYFNILCLHVFNMVHERCASLVTWLTLEIWPIGQKGEIMKKYWPSEKGQRVKREQTLCAEYIKILWSFIHHYDHTKYIQHEVCTFFFQRVIFCVSWNPSKKNWTTSVFWLFLPQAVSKSHMVKSVPTCSSVLCHCFWY